MLVSNSTPGKDVMVNQKSTFIFRLLFGVFPLCTAVHFLFCESINQFQTQQAASSLKWQQQQKGEGERKAKWLRSKQHHPSQQKQQVVACHVPHKVLCLVSEHKVHICASKARPSISDDRQFSGMQCSVCHLSCVPTFLRKIVHLFLTLQELLRQDQGYDVFWGEDSLHMSQADTV